MDEFRSSSDAATCSPKLRDLPAEILMMILGILSKSDLHRLAQTAHHYYQLSLAPLYTSITLQMSDRWECEISMLGSLIQDKTIRMHLRHLTVISDHGPAGYKVPVAEMVTTLLLARPRPPLRSFVWYVSDISTNTASILSNLPSGLRSLHISASTIEPLDQLHGLEELCQQDFGNRWKLQQHHCTSSTLKRMSVHVKSSIPQGLSNFLLQALQQPKLGTCQLSRLYLSGVYLQGWDMGNLSSLEWLSLVNCTKLDTLLSSWMDDYSGDSRLAYLELVVGEESEILPQFLSHKSTARLKTLKIQAQRKTVLPIESIQSTELATLLVESRRLAYDPMTIHLYQFEQLFYVLSHCKRLTTIGIPVNMIPGRGRVGIDVYQHMLPLTIIVYVEY